MIKISEIKQKINHAIEQFYQNDSDLLNRDNYEVTVSCKLSQYLCPLFQDYSVDSEYNKHIDSEKHNSELNKEIRPDIIIHKRGNDDDNLVYIEIKTDHNNDNRQDDIKKVISMTKQTGEYKYKLGIFIDFNRNRENLVVHHFKDGEEIQ